MELHRNTRELHQSINYLQEQSYINRYLPEFVNLEALHLRLMSIPWGVREKFFTRIQTTYPNLKTLSLQVLNFTQDMRNALRNVLRDMNFIEVLHLYLWISLRTYPHDDATEQSEILSLSTEISKLHQLRDFALRYKDMSNGLNAFLGPVFRALTSTQITKLTIGYSIKLDDPTEILLRRLLEVRNLTSMRIETLSVSKDSIGEYHNFVVKSFTNSSTKSDVINPLEFNSFDVSVCARPVEKDFSHLKDLESFSYIDPGEDDEFNLNP
ncbi:hypothetical protein HK098_000714 [Nowakowskiella sp. JEL0407]|nr:hypothetical protein HK098_000714 [Nowakowskiella sp. JEL0407]